SMRHLSGVGQAEAAGLLVRLEDYPIGAHPLQPDRPLPADRAVAYSRLSPAHRTLSGAGRGRPRAGAGAAWRPPGTGRGGVHRWRGDGQVLAPLVADVLVVDQSLAWPRARPGCWTAPTDSSPLAGRYPAIGAAGCAGQWTGPRRPAA